VTLRARWVTLRARWVTLRARWVTLRARWVTLRSPWRCLGSDGHPTERGLTLDGAAALRWLAARIPEGDRIVLHCESIGAPLVYAKDPLNSAFLDGAVPHRTHAVYRPDVS
jgi:fermentation-respiration switch protein FrsA (DUF1100 family)